MDIERSHFDYLIIGAGPAGTACGTELLRQGLRPCLIDKAVFPRHKTCGGLVTGKTFQLIQDLFGPEADLSGLFTHAVSEVGIYHNHQELVHTDFGQKARFVNRTFFDNALVEQYKSAGGTLIEGEAVSFIDYQERFVRLAGGQEISYRFLVFADGVLSLSRKPLHVKQENYAFGLEVLVQNQRIDPDRIGLHFGHLKNGYIWVFPYGKDCFCIGAGGKYTKEVSYREVLSSFLEAEGIRTEGLKYQGAFIPYGYLIPQKKLPDNVLLCGDAGGFADPISGEGLYFALLTGRKAAQALLTGRPKQSYLQSVKQAGQTVREGKRLQQMFFLAPVQKFFLKHVSGNQRFVKYFFERQVSEYTYRYGKILQLLHDYKRQKKQHP